MNYQKVNGVHDYVNVGTWEDNLLTLDLEKVVWPGVELPIGQVPMSFCSHDCELGYRKDMTDNKQCCWVCYKMIKLLVLQYPSTRRVCCAVKPAALPSLSLRLREIRK